MFIKKTFNNTKKDKRIKNNVLKCNLHLYFLIQQKLLISGEKIMMSVILKKCVTWFIYFWIFFRWGITVLGFIIVGYVGQILGRRHFSPHPSMSSPKRPILDMVSPQFSRHTQRRRLSRIFLFHALQYF